MYRVLLSLKNDVKGSTNELAMNIACGDINAANRGKMHTHTRPNIRSVPKHVWPGYLLYMVERIIRNVPLQCKHLSTA